MKTIFVIFLLALTALLGAVLLTIPLQHEKKARNKIQYIIAQGACILVCAAPLLMATLGVGFEAF